MKNFEKIISLNFVTAIVLFMLQTSALGAQNTMELHSGSVKLIREGKSQIIRTAGEKLQLLANDRLQTGGNTDVSLYLRDGKDTVKLFSNSFFKLDDSSDNGNSVALLIGRLNFSVKPLSEAAEDEEDSVDNAEKETEEGEKRSGNLVVNLKGKLAKLEKSKLRPKKRRFELRTVSALIGVRGTDGKCRTNPNLPDKDTDPPPSTLIEAGTTEDFYAQYFGKYRQGLLKEIEKNNGSLPIVRAGEWLRKQPDYQARLDNNGVQEEERLTIILRALGFALEGNGNAARVKKSSAPAIPDPEESLD